MNGSTLHLAPTARTPHELENLIHQHLDCDTITGFKPYIGQMGNVGGDYDHTDTRHYNEWMQLIREYNRKLDNCDMTAQIQELHDGGLYPDSVPFWFTQLGFTYTFDFPLS